MINLKQLKENITDEQIIEILKFLGANKYNDIGKSIIFPTICHNIDDSDASMKLYYYKSNKMFHCYTECDGSFDIIDLIMRNHKNNNKEINFYEALDIIFSFTGKIDYIYNGQKKYQSIGDYYKRKGTNYNLEPCNPHALDIFYFYPTIEWLNEGISVKTMKDFNILYSPKENKIVIPHYDKNGILVGIRGRSLDEEDAIRNGKYRPLRIESNYYAHPLSYNLYGLNISKENIAIYREAIVFEGEKSVLKFHDMSNYYNTSAAVCGSTINKIQVMELVNAGAKEIILAFDKEYDSSNSKDAEKYFNKLQGLANKYKNYCNFSFIYDMDSSLNIKDSPIDKGLLIFTKLYKKRIRVK